MGLADFLKRNAKPAPKRLELPPLPDAPPASSRWGARVVAGDGTRGRALFADDDWIAYADDAGRLHFGRRSWLRGGT